MHLGGNRPWVPLKIILFTHCRGIPSDIHEFTLLELHLDHVMALSIKPARFFKTWEP